MNEHSFKFLDELARIWQNIANRPYTTTADRSYADALRDCSKMLKTYLFTLQHFEQAATARRAWAKHKTNLNFSKLPKNLNN